MSKNLRQLREKASAKGGKVKLEPLQPPKDNTVATQHFYKKHVAVHHPDPAGNGDDVYKASNITPVKRSPEHGYDPGKDEEIYESAYKRIHTKRQERQRLIKGRKERARLTKAVRINNIQDIIDGLEDDHRSSRKAFGKTMRDKYNKYLTQSFEYDYVTESAPPGKDAENWIRSNKSRFIKEYGEEKGLRVLYARAWKLFGESLVSEAKRPLLASTQEQRAARMAARAAKEAEKAKTREILAQETDAMKVMANKSFERGKVVPSDPVSVINRTTQPGAPNLSSSDTLKRWMGYWKNHFGMENPRVHKNHFEYAITSLYNTLNEENREVMLKLMESEEGVVSLVEFAIEKGID